MSAEAINKVSEEEIKYITDEAFDWIFKNLVTLAMEILKEMKEEKNEEKFAKLVIDIFKEHLKQLEKLTEEKIKN